jgi:transposase InsO family protein
VFEHLKRLICEEPVLIQPDQTKPFEVEVDASNYAVGAVLMQRDEKKILHPVAFFSKTMNEAQRNYDVYNCELLGLCKMFRHWRHYLHQAAHKVKVHTDHANLLFWKNPGDHNRRVAWWHAELMDYDFELVHIAGIKNGRADALSRCPDYNQGEDNKKLVVLPENFFQRAYARLAGSDEADPNEAHSWQRMTKGLDNGKYGSLQERIVKDQQKEASKKKISRWTNTYQINKVHDTWWKEDRIVVAGDNDLKRGVIHYFHDTPSAGHPGITNTYNLAKRDTWWPYMKQDVEQYVKGCAVCQANKANTRPLRPGMAPITPEHSLPFQTVAMDFITKLPKSGKREYDTILTITDHDCTKAAIFIPCHETITAEGVATLYLRHVYPRFGIPRKVISDRDTRFMSKFTKGLNVALGIRSNMSTAYHPQTDGQLERTNQSLETFIRCYCDEEQDNWHIWLPMAEFAHNQWPNATTKKVPFDLIMGYVPHMEQIKKPSPVPQVEERLTELERVRKVAWEAMLRVQAMLQVKNPGGRKFRPYEEGEQVWIEGTNLKTLYPSAKLGPKRYRPFKVLKQFSNAMYQVEIPRRWKIHNVFHANLLTPYKEMELHGPNFTRPPPDLIEGEEEFEVEKILDVQQRGRGRKTHFLVKWKGYPVSDNSWEKAEDVHAEELVKEFYARRKTNKDKARK